MRIGRFAVGLSLAVSLISVVTVRHATVARANATAPVVPPACEIAPLAAATIAAVTIRAATPDSAPPKALQPPIEVPPFCRVEASVRTAPDSLVNFEVWIPQPWNGKLVVTGNAAYSNALAYRDMTAALAQGYAAAGGDTGHQTPTPDDLLWGVDHPERIVDWGTRSIHAITAPARRIVETVQATAPRRAYYYGCSTGGHQGYAEMQRYPEDFDGVVAGAPGNNRTRLNAGFLWQFLANRSRDSATPILPAAKLPLVTKAVVAACDANDGVRDGVIDDPRTCTFDPAVLACTAGDAADCLTDAQLSALAKMYAGAKNPRTGEQIYPGWPKGSEALTVTADGAPASGWHQYWGSSEPARANFWRYWVFDDPKWDWWNFDFDRHLAQAEARVGSMVDQVNPDLSAFRQRGGKAIVYQGWQDPVVNALDTIAYYERVRNRQDSPRDTDAFFRLFLVPGMGHCGGGPGTTSFGNQNGPAVALDPQHDVLAALDAWVEKGAAPQLVASRVTNGAVVRTRPLCAYPTRAMYTGTGSTDDAANFACR